MIKDFYTNKLIKFKKTKTIYLDFTRELKKSIIIRDKNICQLCGDICIKKHNYKTPNIHHIDYNPKNANKSNLILLCHQCHSKTGGNRTIWKRFFKLMIISNIINLRRVKIIETNASSRLKTILNDFEVPKNH